MAEKKIIKNRVDPSEYELTPDEVSKVAAYFSGLIGDRSCHICGHRHWYPLGEMHTPDTFNRKKNHHIKTRVFAQVSVVCHKCGTVTSFAANHVGISHNLSKENVEEGE